jgi:hypothetical protein
MGNQISMGKFARREPRVGIPWGSFDAHIVDLQAFIAKTCYSLESILLATGEATRTAAWKALETMWDLFPSFFQNICWPMIVPYKTFVNEIEAIINDNGALDGSSQALHTDTMHKMATGLDNAVNMHSKPQTDCELAQLDNNQDPEKRSHKQMMDEQKEERVWDIVKRAIKLLKAVPVLDDRGVPQAPTLVAGGRKREENVRRLCSNLYLSRQVAFPIFGGRGQQVLWAGGGKPVSESGRTLSRKEGPASMSLVHYAVCAKSTSGGRNSPANVLCIPMALTFNQATGTRPVSCFMPESESWFTEPVHALAAELAMHSVSAAPMPVWYADLANKSKPDGVVQAQANEADVEVKGKGEREDEDEDEDEGEGKGKGKGEREGEDQGQGEGEGPGQGEGKGKGQGQNEGKGEGEGEGEGGEGQGQGQGKGKDKSKGKGQGKKPVSPQQLLERLYEGREEPVWPVALHALTDSLSVRVTEATKNSGLSFILAVLEERVAVNKQLSTEDLRLFEETLWGNETPDETRFPPPGSRQGATLPRSSSLSVAAVGAAEEHQELVPSHSHSHSHSHQHSHPRSHSRSHSHSHSRPRRPTFLL